MGLLEVKCILINADVENLNIAAGIADTLTELGSSVLILSKNIGAKHLKQFSQNSSIKVVDAAAYQFEPLDVICDSIVADLDRLDALVNIPYFDSAKFISDLDAQTLSDMHGNTTCNIISVSRWAASFMKKTAQRGSIINVIPTNTSRKFSSNHKFFRHNLINLSRSLAQDLAPHNIRVNVLTPGLIREDDFASSLSFESFDSERELVPMKKSGGFRDIAGSCFFLASGLSEYITGEEINIDGGLKSIEACV